MVPHEGRVVQNSAIRRILVVKLRYIGDVLLTTPVIRALRVHFPQARITALVNPGTEEILVQNPHLDDILLMPRTGWMAQASFLRSIRAQRFECVLDLTDGDRAAFVTAITGASIRIGFNHERRWRGKLYSRCVRASYGSMHMVEYHAQALSELGIAPAVGDPEVFLAGDNHRTAERLLIARW